MIIPFKTMPFQLRYVYFYFRCRHGHLCAISNVGYNRYRQCMVVTSNSRQKTADPVGVLLLVGILSLVTKTTL